MTKIIDQKFLDRLREIADQFPSRKKAAAAADVSLDQLQRYLRGDNAPSFFAVARLCHAQNYSLDWLGVGGSHKFYNHPLHENDTRLAIAGMAECGVKGWYNEVIWDNDIEIKIDDPDAFAIIAHGDSMVPEGIQQGHVCICSPQAKPRIGDIIFIKRKDGHTTIKKYEGLSGEWIKLKGYLPREPNQTHQEPYGDQIRQQDVDTLANVVMIKRKL